MKFLNYFKANRQVILRELTVAIISIVTFVGAMHVALDQFKYWPLLVLIVIGIWVSYGKYHDAVRGIVQRFWKV